jgi:SAM-dependent methyltransferase
MRRLREPSIAVARLYHALRRRGLRWTARRLIEIGLTRGERREMIATELEFDRRYGVDTAGLVPLEALEIKSGNRNLGNRYQATNPEIFQRLLRSLSVDYRGFTFVDIGSGKGRALLLASEYPFERIIGVEFARDLVEVARRNIQAFHSPNQLCTEIEVCHKDATEFGLPSAPLVLYFWNPFLAPVMERVLANVKRSLHEFPRPLYIIFYGDDVSVLPLIEEAGFRRSRFERVGAAATAIYEPAA